jgi:hypothetical protein
MRTFFLKSATTPVAATGLHIHIEPFEDSEQGHNSGSKLQTVFIVNIEPTQNTVLEDETAHTG